MEPFSGIVAHTGALLLHGWYAFDYYGPSLTDSLPL